LPPARLSLRPRATLSMLYGREVTPVGGNTEFCDMRLAWEALPIAVLDTAALHASWNRASVPA